MFPKVEQMVHDLVDNFVPTSGNPYPSLPSVEYNVLRSMKDNPNAELREHAQRVWQKLHKDRYCNTMLTASSVTFGGSKILSYSYHRIWTLDFQLAFQYRLLHAYVLMHIMEHQPCNYLIIVP